MPSGQIVVANGEAALWGPGSGWHVKEVVRIGSFDKEGPDVFGRITAFGLADKDRIWILDDLAQDIRVFTAAGDYVRTVGRRGSGPGEFGRAVRLDVDPAGRMWVMDPQNNRVSIFDSAGTYLGGRSGAGNFLIFPWPGGFDDAGRYYAPVPRFQNEHFSFGLARYDTSLTSIDTVEIPRDPHQRKFFSIQSTQGGVSAGVPFQGKLVWNISRSGTLWTLLTDEYRLLEISAKGDTIRKVTRKFAPAPVTEQDRAKAREDLKWFTDQGGKVDWALLPSTKPVANGFFQDDEGSLWVDVLNSDTASFSTFDVFNRDGVYFGAVHLPLKLEIYPLPIIRNGRLYAVARDSLDVQSLVVASISKQR